MKSAILIRDFEDMSVVGAVESKLTRLQNLYFNIDEVPAQSVGKWTMGTLAVDIAYDGNGNVEMTHYANGKRMDETPYQYSIEEECFDADSDFYDNVKNILADTTVEAIAKGVIGIDDVQF